MDKLLQSIFFLLLSTIITAQVTSVSYMLDFDYQNGDTLYYDCNIQINSGSATTALDRTSFNAQYTVVTPAESNVEVVESYMPLLNNINYMGTDPTNWMISNILSSPFITPESNYFSITPNIDPITSYNDLAPGDLITLFRIKIIGEDLCSYESRIFNNNQDPSPADFPDGQDFRNGFTVGNINQVYGGNINSDDYAEDIGITLDNATTCVGELAILSPNLTCEPSNLLYLWSTGETTKSISVFNEGSVEYTVTITGPNNYTQTLTAEVNNVLSIANNYTLCVGQQEDLKLDNGIWQSSNPAVVTVDFDGIATGITPGTAVLTYMDNDSGCAVDASFIVTNPPPITITGDVEICIGETTALSSGGEVGTWVSSDPNIGTIDNNGLVTGVGSGTATFTFTSNTTLCQSMPSEPITVHPTDIITLEQDNICPGETSLANSSTFDGATWISNNPTIATIDALTGVITAITEGCVTFTFTNNLGCFTQSPILCVNPDIQVSIVGADQICVGGTTQLSPSSGGLWVSADATVATVDNSGLVTGTGFGTTNFSFQDTVNYCAEGTTEAVTVGNTQGIANLGSDEICLNGNTQLSPNTGGNWTSSNTDVAFSNNTGEVTGVGIGVAQLIFTTDLDNCEVVDEDIDILVNAPPAIVLIGPSTICVQGFTTISTNGNLMHVEPGVSTYTDSGVITGLTPGVTEYYAINAEGCSSDTIEVTVIGSADVTFSGPDEICIGQETSVTPSIGGTWTSSDNTVATISNSGIVTGVGAGTAILDFTDTTNGCVTSNGLEVTVYNSPDVGLETDIICAGNETLAYPSTGGTWTSNDPSIATISNSGVILANSSGTVQLVFTPLDNSCTSEPLDLTVIATPTLISQQTEICFGDSLFVQLAGTTSLNILGPNGYTSSPSTTTGSIIVDFPTPGTYILTPIDESSSGCLPEQTIITVLNNPILEPASSPTIFVGETLGFVSPDFIASLSSEDESIALVTSNLSIIGLSEGVTQITGISDDGCPSNTIQVTVISSDPCQGLDTTDQSYILGTAYIDNNSNGTYDTGDAPLRNVVISTEPGDFSILTDDFGNYILPVLDGSYALIAKVNEGSWVQDLLTIENIQISEPCNIGYNFGFIPIPAPAESASISMTNTIARCDWETNFTITVENTGAEPFDGVLAFTYDDETTLFTTDLVDFQVDGNTISSELGSLSPFLPQTYRVTVKMPGGSSNLPMLAFEAKLYNQSGALIEEYGYSDQLRCSYDPNDKREYPDREGDENLTLMDEDLEYTIRFQNNGNDTAFLVTIVDPLDPNIDPTTIRVMNASHPVETCIDGTDLIFLFEDIFLVDSTTNYDASQGFVTFRCNVKKGLQEFTPVHNQADIIFDTNEPILTNQTINTLVSVLCTDKETVLEAAICSGATYLGYTESGTYNETFGLPYGCDSVVTILLDIQQITYAQQNIQVCAGDQIIISDITYIITENTAIIDTSFSENGCVSSILTYQIDAASDVFETVEDINLCPGETFSFNPTLEGSWVSNDPSVILVDQNGNFSVSGTGSTTLTFTDSQLGCTDDLPVTVNPIPKITNIGSDQICINDSTVLVADEIGTWASENQSIATINNDGIVFGLAQGVANFNFTDSITGCAHIISVEVLSASDPMCIVSAYAVNDNQVKLYPNPSTESIFVETEDNWESIRIVDTQGKLLSLVSQAEIGKLEIDVSQYSSGVYMIIFQDGDKNLTKRFVVR